MNQKQFFPLGILINLIGFLLIGSANLQLGMIGMFLVGIVAVTGSRLPA